MREIDIEVGQKYRVKENVGHFVKKGAVVRVLVKGPIATSVQDLSKNKCMDGIWGVPNQKLAPLKGIDPEEIKVGLRVKHKKLGAGTVTEVTRDCGFLVDFDVQPKRYKKICWFSRTLDNNEWTCSQLSILNEKDSVLDRLQKECDEALLEALYDYAQRQCKEALEELKALNTLNADSLEGRCEGNKIILTSVKDGKKVEASASCSPDDTFDYITGSQIALARLAQKCGKPAKVYLPKDTKDFQIEFI